METAFPIENRADLTAAAFDRLAEALAEQRSIKQALDWLVCRQPPATFTDLVAQDEFSHDVLASLAGGLWLVYDTT